MMEFILFVAVIAIVYAVKSVAIVKKHEELADNSASFSWMSARREDAVAAAEWEAAEAAAEAAAARRAASSMASLRHVGGVSA